MSLSYPCPSNPHPAVHVCEPSLLFAQALRPFTPPAALLLPTYESVCGLFVTREGGLASPNCMLTASLQQASPAFAPMAMENSISNPENPWLIVRSRN